MMQIHNFYCSLYDSLDELEKIQSHFSIFSFWSSNQKVIHLLLFLLLLPPPSLPLPSSFPSPSSSLMATPATNWSSQSRGQIEATSASLDNNHSHAGSPISWVRSGSKPTSLWIVVGFIYTAPQLKLPNTEKSWRFKSFASDISLDNFQTHLQINTSWF